MTEKLGKLTVLEPQLHSNVQDRNFCYSIRFTGAMLSISVKDQRSRSAYEQILVKLEDQRLWSQHDQILY